MAIARRPRLRHYPSAVFGIKRETERKEIRMLATGLLLATLVTQAMAGSRMLLQEEKGFLSGVRPLNQVDECTNTYLSLKDLSDQNSEALSLVEEGVALNKLQLQNLTERIAINSATLVRSSVNISELNIQARQLAQNLAMVNNEIVANLQTDALLQPDINGLLNSVTLEETAMILPIDGNVITPNETLTATSNCPSGYRPIRIDCAISGLDQSSFVEEGSGSALGQPPVSSVIRESIEGTAGTCSYQIFYLDVNRVQTNIVFDSVTAATPPVTVSATTTCRAA
ncbi:hypothetical protein M9434_004709 [Picochlorum sp. BPE23]|nr:hypothetical protein M9434_004709 [Picochlorum sp. BPE23]